MCRLVLDIIFNWNLEIEPLEQVVLPIIEDTHCVFVKLTHKNEHILNDNDAVTEYLSYLQHRLLLYHNTTVVHKGLSMPYIISEVNSKPPLF